MYFSSFITTPPGKNYGPLLYKQESDLSKTHFVPSMVDIDIHLGEKC